MSKLKIMQQGGGLIYTPFIPGMQGTTSTSSSRSNTSEGESKIDALDKELIALMKSEDLLPSDISFITNQVVKFQKRASNLSATGDYSSAMPGMLQIIGAVKKAKYFKDQSDSAATQMAKENAGGEFALDSRGLMYVLNKETGKLDKVDIDKFDSEKYSALSNSELLFYRQTSLPNDTAIFSDIQNAVGIGSVIKEIDRIIKEYGTSENVQYLTKDRAAQQVILDANSPDGIYKLSTKKPSGDMRTAWLSIYRQLTPNMQHLLDVRAKTSGMNIPEYISDIVLRNIDTKIDANYDSTVSKAAGFDVDPNKTVKESAEQLTQNNYLQRVGSLRGDRTVVSIAPRGSKISDTAALSAHAFTFGAVIDRSNKPVENMSVSDLMREGWAFAAGEPNDVVFGNKLLKDWERDALLFDNNSNLTAVMLPYKNQGGHIVPDFELLDTFNKIQETIQTNSNISKTELSSLLLQSGISPSEINYDPNTNTISLKNTMAFLTVSCYAGDDTIDLTKDDKRYLEKLSKSDGQHIKDYYNNMVKYGKLRPAKKGNVKIKGYSESEANDFWRGNIFIPMKNAFNAMNLSGIGEYVPKSQEANFYENVTAKEQENLLQQYVRDNDPDYIQNTQLGQFRYE